VKVILMRPLTVTPTDTHNRLDMPPRHETETSTCTVPAYHAPHTAIPV